MSTIHKKYWKFSIDLTISRFVRIIFFLWYGCLLFEYHALDQLDKFTTDFTISALHYFISLKQCYLNANLQTTCNHQCMKDLCIKLWAKVVIGMEICTSEIPGQLENFIYPRLSCDYTILVVLVRFLWTLVETFYFESQGRTFSVVFTVPWHRVHILEDTAERMWHSRRGG